MVELDQRDGLAGLGLDVGRVLVEDGFGLHEHLLIGAGVDEALKLLEHNLHVIYKILC